MARPSEAWLGRAWRLQRIEALVGRFNGLLEADLNEAKFGAVWSGSGPMTVLDLFSGIGGFSLGLSWAGGYETVGFCEIEEFPRRVLAHHWPGVWIHDDIRSLTAGLVREHCGPVDLICGGFPCQDISAAGKGAGIHGERSGLFFEAARLIRDLRPRWVLLENVPALRTRGADAVLAELEGQGYACRALVVGAWAVGAPHKRDRVWIVGYAEGNDERRTGQRPGRPEGAAGGPSTPGLADTCGEPCGCGQYEPGRQAQRGIATCGAGEGGRGLDNASSARCARHTRCDSARSLRDEAWREEPAGPCSCSELADAAHGGLRADGRAPGQSGHADERYTAVADACVTRLAERWKCSGGASAEKPVLAGGGNPGRWPARPGEPQHEWEAPRLVESGLGGVSHGLSRGVARRAGRRRREQLKALGNAVVPQVVCALGRAIMQADAQAKEAMYG